MDIKQLNKVLLDLYDIQTDGIYCINEAIDVSIQLMKKAIPMRPILNRNLNTLRYPICKCCVETETEEYNYCQYCGQRIDWSE